MNIIEFDKEIEKQEKKLAKLKKQRLEEINNMVSCLNVGDIFNITKKGMNFDNWVCYRIDEINHDEKRIAYSMLNKHTNDWSSTSEENFEHFFIQLESFTDYMKMYEREYKLKQLKI